VKRTAGQILMLLLVIAGSLLMSIQGLLPRNQWDFQWLIGVMGVLVLVFFIDGLIVLMALLRQAWEQTQAQKTWNEQSR